MYHGRRMVPDVEHLYQVVDDRQAHENYDTLMEIARRAGAQTSELPSDSPGSHGSRKGSRRSRRSRGGGGSRESSQEQKQNWARMKEEELVYRMLSQFFGELFFNQDQETTICVRNEKRPRSPTVRVHSCYSNLERIVPRPLLSWMKTMKMRTAPTTIHFSVLTKERASPKPR
mmetsp:Transcript_58360/g.123779  ORF Transcript_58360/g.123779 Transcript_58360/m.123779 type:complete len:173 (+) Transcript_58360:844-1362(+)